MFKQTRQQLLGILASRSLTILPLQLVNHSRQAKRVIILLQLVWALVLELTLMLLVILVLQAAVHPWAVAAVADSVVAVICLTVLRKLSRQLIRRNSKLKSCS